MSSTVLLPPRVNSQIVLFRVGILICFLPIMIPVIQLGTLTWICLRVMFTETMIAWRIFDSLLLVMQRHQPTVQNHTVAVTNNNPKVAHNNGDAHVTTQKCLIPETLKRISST